MLQVPMNFIESSRFAEIPHSVDCALMEMQTSLSKLSVDLATIEEQSQNISFESIYEAYQSYFVQSEEQLKATISELEQYGLNTQLIPSMPLL